MKQIILLLTLNFSLTARAESDSWLKNARIECLSRYGSVVATFNPDTQSILTSKISLADSDSERSFFAQASSKSGFELIFQYDKRDGLAPNQVKISFPLKPDSYFKLTQILSGDCFLIDQENQNTSTLSEQVKQTHFGEINFWIPKVFKRALPETHPVKGEFLRQSLFKNSMKNEYLFVGTQKCRPNIDFCRDPDSSETKINVSGHQCYVGEATEYRPYFQSYLRCFSQTNPKLMLLLLTPVPRDNINSFLSAVRIPQASPFEQPPIPVGTLAKCQTDETAFPSQKKFTYAKSEKVIRADIYPERKNIVDINILSPTPSLYTDYDGLIKFGVEDNDINYSMSAISDLAISSNGYYLGKSLSMSYQLTNFTNQLKGSYLYGKSTCSLQGPDLQN